MYQLDRIDLKILDELQKDSKQSVKSLSEKVGLSITPVHERIKRMENTGVIQKYAAVAGAGAGQGLGCSVYRRSLGQR